jgi:hypothetical protein
MKPVSRTFPDRQRGYLFTATEQQYQISVNAKIYLKCIGKGMDNTLNLRLLGRLLPILARFTGEW